MRRCSLRTIVLAMLAIVARRACCEPTSSSASAAEDSRVRGLVRDWAPLVWLAPGERFLPLGVPEFLENMQADDDYLRTRLSLQSLLENRTSFLHGRKPAAGSVPIYALVKNCRPASPKATPETTATSHELLLDDKRPPTNLPGNLLVDDDDFPVNPIESNNVPGNLDTSDVSAELLQSGKRFSRSRPVAAKLYGNEMPPAADSRKRRKLKPLLRAKKKQQQPQLHFHVTYWMFYPFSEGKAVCVLDLGFLGSWPIPNIGGVCLGKLKEYGSHVGDWEHVSLYFKDKEHPLAMYVSAHDAGAFYRYDPRSGTFLYESQETRKGIFQKPIFPERVHTSDGSHPVLFSARGSHGLWTAPGKHKFVRLPRLYDESGFGTPWPTWKQVELLSVQEKSVTPGWMTFQGRWGNPKSNCHPLAKLGFDICEFVDGPTGIPMKKMNFRC